MAKEVLTMVLVGRVLSEAVTDSDGILLLNSGSVLTVDRISFLLRKGILDVSVEPMDRVEMTVDKPDIRDRQKVDRVIDRFKNVSRNLKIGNALVYQEIEDMVEPLFDGLRQNDDMLRLMMVIDRFDGYTFEHSVMVSMLSGLLAKWLRYSENQVRDLVLTGLLHDIGKANIPDSILYKRGELTKEERRIMTDHPFFSYVLAREVYAAKPEVLEGIRNHHERIDGSGYPKGLKGDEIGPYAKIVMVADVFAAMTANTLYRPKHNPFATFAELLRAPLDPRCVEVFIDHISSYFLNMRVRLNDGQQGEIIHIDRQTAAPVISKGNVYVDLSKEKHLVVTEILSEEE